MQLLPTHGTEQGQTLHEIKQAMEVVGSWFMGAMLHADVQKAMEKEFEKGVYITKVDELKKQGDRIEQRYKEHAEQDSVVHQLISYITCYKQDAASNDLKYEHIDINEKQKKGENLSNGLSGVLKVGFSRPLGWEMEVIWGVAVWGRWLRVSWGGNVDEGDWNWVGGSKNSCSLDHGVRLIHSFELSSDHLRS
ncbi:hypothetical protein Tco_0121108 [Tanacetum coccineum]